MKSPWPRLLSRISLLFFGNDASVAGMGAARLGLQTVRAARSSKQQERLSAFGISRTLIMSLDRFRRKRIRGTVPIMEDVVHAKNATRAHDRPVNQ